MTIKALLLTLTTLFLIGCSPNSPTKKAFRHQTSTPTKTQAILKLDTKGHTAMIRDIIVTKSGDIISASDDKRIRVWDSKTGKEKRKILGQIGVGNEGKIFAMALSPNEEFLAIGGLLTGKNNSGKSSIRIYNYQSGRLLKVLKSHTNIINDLAFSSDGKYLISGSGDFTAKIWETEDFSLIDTIKFHTNDIYAVKIIKKEGNYFAVTAGYDNRIALYSMQTKKIVKSHRLNYKLTDLAVSKNNIALCSGFSKKISIYDYNLNIIKTITSKTKPKGLAYSPNGDFLIAGSATPPRNVNIYSVNQNYKKITTFTKHKNLVQAVTFLDNQTAISGGGNNSEIYIWDIKTAQVLKKIEGVGDTVWSVGVKGDRIAWGNIDDCSGKNCSKFQKSINLKNFQILGQGLKSLFHRISTTYKSYQLIHRKGGDYGYTDGVLDIKRDGKTIASIIRGSTNGYAHNCYGFYKNYIVSGGANGHLKIYNLEGKEIANLVGHTGMVWSIALDGDRLVSGSNDQIIKIWDLSKLKRQMQPQLSLFISKTNDWIAWTPQGFYNASKGGEKYIGYHINHGAEHESEFLDISRFRKQFYRPNLIQKALDGEDLTLYAKNIDINSLLKAGLPPKVKFVTDSTVIDKGTIALGIEICDEGGSYDNLQFYVDDAPIKYLSQTKAFRQQKSSDGNCDVITETIVVPSGKHVVGFNATNKEGNIVSNTSTITITNTKKPTRKPNLHILTLTVADYKDDRLDLKFPNNDATEIISKLQKVKGNIFGKVYPYSLKDSQVSYKNIQKKVKEIASKVIGEDVFILYISGHGITDDSNGNYYFIPYACPKEENIDLEKYAISHDKLNRVVVEVGASKSAIFLDTCESGGMVEKEGSLDESAQRFAKGLGRAIIAGASSQQLALDGYKKHGYFTYTVLDAIKKTQHYGEDRELSINEIAGHVKYVLPKISDNAQKPTIYLNGDTTFSVGGL